MKHFITESVPCYCDSRYVIFTVDGGYAKIVAEGDLLSELEAWAIAADVDVHVGSPESMGARWVR